MKKFIFSMMAVIGMSLALTSCSSEEDMPQVDAPATNSLEASFPKGAKVKKIGVTIPKEMRTRADGDTDLPLWDVFSNKEKCLYLRYGVYVNDKLYYSTDVSVSLPTITSSETFDLKIPTPSIDQPFKVFIWADKLGNGGSHSRKYTIDWNNFEVSYAGDWVDSFNGLALNENLGQDGDAWYTWTTINPDDSLDVTLERAVMQVNILTDEHSYPGLKTYFSPNRCVVNAFFCNEDGKFAFPTGWNWNTNKLTFGEIPDDYSLNSVDTYKIASLQKAKLNGKEYAYVACFYTFAADAVVNFKDDVTNYSNLYVKVYDKTAKKQLSANTINLGDNLVKNNRIVVYHDDSDPENGFFQGGSAALKVNVNTAYGNTSVSQQQ